MTKEKSTKRALVSSALAILMCMAMLIGTTFAWFTDTASTAVNKIQSGTLKVGLEMATKWDNDGNPTQWDTAEGEMLTFKTVDNRESEKILWEPGCTYELPELRVVNEGSLALKYKVVITGIQGDSRLNEVIDWTMTLDGADYVVGSEHSLKAMDGDNMDFDVLTIKGHMQEGAGNEYQDKSIDGIAITVYATQDTVENDSYGNQYDKDATYPTYPAGLTKDSFDAEEKAVDGKGNFYTSFKDAMENVEDNGTLYFKEDGLVDFPTHLNVTKNVTIYANGTDFSGKDISIGTYVAPENTETTVNIYGAKNLVVWGQPIEGRADTWNVNFYNCVNDGYNFLMYRGSETATAKINLTMTNCTATGFHDSIVHTTADGTIKITDCVFNDNCAPVNIAHKQTGDMTITVENSTFNGCGKIDVNNDYFAPARFVNNSETGTLNVTLKNNTFVNTIGTNGDILLGDYRSGKASNAIKAEIITKNPVMVKSSAESAYSYNGGKIDIQ